MQTTTTGGGRISPDERKKMIELRKNLGHEFSVSSCASYVCMRVQVHARDVLTSAVFHV